MKRLIISLAIGIMASLSLGVATLGTAQPVMAQSGSSVVCNQISGIPGGEHCTPNNTEANKGIFKLIRTRIVQLLIFLVGGISVLMIVIGGLMYVLSGGDGQNTAKAKDTIMYALIGLAVALFAQAMVSFVLRRIF